MTAPDEPSYAHLVHEAIIDAPNDWAREFLAQGGSSHPEPTSSIGRAQDMIHDARDLKSVDAQARLARQALEVSPDCADAYVPPAMETRDPAEAAAHYAQGVAAGERALGEAPLRQSVGYFWTGVETRPCTRARLGPAAAVWALGKRLEAIYHLWDVLRLNQDDYPGGPR